MSNQTHQIQEDLSKPKTPREYLRLYLSGFAMGSADVVPGVSGGTMAFILGVYTTLLNAIKSFNFDALRAALKLDIKRVFEIIPYRFLIALMLGTASAVLLLANMLDTLLQEQPTFIFAFFGGLIIASIVAIGVKVRWSVSAMGALLVAAIFAFFITGFGGQNNPVGTMIDAVRSGDSAEIAIAEAELIAALTVAEYPNPAEAVAAFQTAIETGVGQKELKDGFDETLYVPSSPTVLFFSGAIAICAMILPGISGSFILLILGQYTVILGAVKTLDLVTLGIVGAGSAVGLMLFSRVLSWLLNRYENITIAALVGFMVGSMRLIVAEASEGVRVVSDTGELAGNQWALVIALVMLGFLLVSFLDHLQSRANPVFAWFWKPTPTTAQVPSGD